jgi:hypothetical protein
MKEKNRHILKRAIGNLPAYKMGETDFWVRFDNQRDGKYKTRIGNGINDLPEFDAPKGLWERVESELDKRPNNQILRPFSFMIRVAAAAVVILSIGFGIILIKHKYTPEYARESVVDEKIIPVSKDEMDGLPIFNPSACEGNPQICNTVLFKALDRQLKDVKEELHLMRPLVHKDDPQMMKYYYRLENLRVEIEKKMLKMIMES